MANHQRADDCAIDLRFLTSSSAPHVEDVSQHAFKCHCCYEVILDPTTLNCGHSFCRHCLALWLQASQKMECPECCEIFTSFPKTNISLRDLVEMQFPDDMMRRRQIILGDPQIARILQAFQVPMHATRAAPPPMHWHPWLGAGGFFSGVLVTLTFGAVVFLVYHWSGGHSDAELLVKKPLTAWKVGDVNIWMENLGPWTSPYRNIFLKEQVNGRLLNALGEEDLLKPPYSIVNELHRRAVKQEVRAVQALGYKRPQTLWEYKAVNEKKSFFLLFGLIDFPRLAILYMYFFDYYDSFLPFIHICCPSEKTIRLEDGLSFRNLFSDSHSVVAPSSPVLQQESPSSRQWLGFLVKLFLFPYQLLSDFAWEWLEVHPWTSRIIMLSAFLLTLQEGSMLRSHRQSINIRLVPCTALCYTFFMGCWWVGWTLLWNVMPQFVCNCLFYWALYCTPVISAFNLMRFVCQEIR